MAFRLSADYYQVLGVQPGAEPEAIENAYRSLMNRYGDHPGESERVRQITTAYKALSDPERKRRYDQVRNSPRPIPPIVAAPAPFMATAGAGEIGRHDEEIARPAARAPVQPPPPPLADPHPDLYSAWDEEPPRSRRTHWLAGGLVVLAGLLLAFLLFGRQLLDTSPDSTGPQVAAVEPGQGTGGASFGGLDIAGEAPVPGAAPAAGQPAIGDVPVWTPVPAPGAAAPVPGALAPVPGTAAAPPAPASTAPAPGAPPATREATAAVPSIVPPAEQAQPLPEPAERPAVVAAVPPPPPTPSRAEPARWIGGGLVDDDNRRGRFEGAVGVQVTVLPNGRAGGCRVTRSSGDQSLDATTCQLLEQRLEFQPARDAEGRPVVSEINSTHVWGRRRRR